MRYISYIEEGKKKTGWVNKRELLDFKKDFIHVQCEDYYGGARGDTVNRDEVSFEKEQKPAPLGRAYFGVYLDENGKIIGKYIYTKKDGLIIKEE